MENVFSQKIPVSGGLPVLIPKNRRFLSKTTAFLVEYAKNEVYILYNSTKKCVSLFTFCEF